MALSAILPAVVVLLSAAAASLWGGRPEKFGSFFLGAWYCTDLLFHAVTGASSFSDLDRGHAIIDTLYCTTFVWLALRSNRLWPIFACGWINLSLLGHASIATGMTGRTVAYWAMTQIPPIIVGVIVLAAIFRHRARRRTGQRPRDWRLLSRT